MTPGELIVGAVCAYLLGWAAVAAVSLVREAYAEKRAEEWAEDWCATHVDPYLPDLPAPWRTPTSCCGSPRFGRGRCERD